MSKKRTECATVQLGLIMTDEMAQEGGLGFSQHISYALVWAQAYEYAKGPFHAEKLADLTIKVLVKEKPYYTKLLDRLKNPKKSTVRHVAGGVLS